MFTVAVHEFGAFLEIGFPKPRSIFAAKEPVQALIEAYADRFPPPRGNARELRVTQDSTPFEYALTAPLFGRLGSLRVDAFQATATVDGGRSEEDARLISDALVAVSEIVAPPPGSTFRAGAYAHGSFSDPSAFATLFEQDLDGVALSACGVHGNLRVANWPFPIHVLREPSKKVTGGCFTRWETETPAPLPLTELVDAFVSAARALRLDLSIQPLPADANTQP